MSILLARKTNSALSEVNRAAALLSSQRNRVEAGKARISTSQNEDDEFIQRSSLPTNHFQKSLPRLPIPTLEKSCERYLAAQKPLLIEEQLRHTESCVKRFLTGEGPALQKELKGFDWKNRHTSYITEFWFDMYLRDRKPLPINYNPLIAFTPEEDKRYEDQLVKSTNIIVSSLRFMKSLRHGVLGPEIYHLNPKKSDTETFRKITKMLPGAVATYGAYFFKAFPLDMSQFESLFNASRIPELEKDMVYQDTSARHIVVMRKGHFYKFDVLDEQNHIVPAKEMASRLKWILEDPTEECKDPIGILTTSERDSWAVTRSHLTEIGNREVLRAIDSAIMLLILDEDKVADDYKKLLRNFLHGSGTNRWFDKTFSLIVAKDGTAAVNFEHSWGDGVAVLRYFQDIKKDISEKPRFKPEDLDSLGTTPVERLQVVVDERIQTAVAEAKSVYQKWTGSLDINFMIYDGFGKTECKRLGVSPDAIMQLAFQLAHYKLERAMVATYESCSTAIFKHGRTETIRSCTNETRMFCEAITDPSSKMDKSQLKNMILECSKTHGRLTKEAATGKGFDRHLFGLRKMWEKAGTPKPAIFEDPSYDSINHNVLSTSTLSSPAVMAGGFGPVVSDGYGIGYMIQDGRLGAVITNYEAHRNGRDYTSNLESSFKEINDILKHQ